MRGDRLVLTRASDSCTPAVFDLGSAAVAANAPLDSLGCKWVTGLRLSPGPGPPRRHLPDRRGRRLPAALVRTADGAVLRYQPAWGGPLGKGSSMLAELAWLDDTAVRVIIVPVDAQSRLLVDVTVSARGLTR